MKKIISFFLLILLACSLFAGCNSNKDSQLDNSAPSQSENPTLNNGENEIPSIPELPFGDNPVKLPDDEFE